MNKGLLSVFLLFVYSSCFSEMISFGDSASSISSPKIAYKKQSIDFKISLAGTYSAQNNWLNENSNSIALRLTLDYLRRIRTNKYLQYYQINSAYGYFKIDSMWMKNTDFCRLKIVFSENNSNTFTHTYTLNVNSQLTKTMRRIYNPLNEISEIKKVSGFLNPGNLTLAYGVNWRFWDDNFINFNLATIKISTRPRYNNFILKDSSNIGKTKNAYVFCEYGMSVNTMIYKKVNDFLTWENYSYIFMNGISRRHLNLDVINRFSFKMFKYIEFRMDMHIIYNYFDSYKLQFQNDFTLGLIYGLNRKL